MNPLKPIDPTRRITRLETPTSDIRWDVAVMVMLVLLGALGQPAPR